MTDPNTGRFARTHGHTCGCVGRASPTYRVWQGMLQRCSSRSKDFRRYAGRGISVCDRWLKFEHFLEDMGCKPDGYSLDRIDNNGNYSKDNCRWACPVTQAHNGRVSKLNWEKVGRIRWMWNEGFTQTQIAKEFGITPSNVHHVVLGKTWNKEEKTKKVEG